MTHQIKNIFKRRKTSVVVLGGIKIGGGHPISIQSMTKTDTRNSVETISQIESLADAGCEIIRVAVPDAKAAKAMGEIVKNSPLPVVADIHFDYRLALASVKAGVHGLRLNPGNIKEADKIREVVAAAKDKSIPIRIGVNSGSVPSDLRESVANGAMSLPQAMVEAAMRHIEILEKLSYYDIKISLKASDVPVTVEAYRLMAKRCRYPFHAGITESGSLRSGIIKSSAGLGILLSEGLADTIRVSLTGSPLEEVRVAQKILRSLSLRESAVDMISCPTCGRVSVNLIEIADEIERFSEGIKIPIRIAVMGCEVNGPGEAKDADIGVAGGKKCGVIFKKGKVIKKVPEEKIAEEMKREIENYIREEEKNDGR